MRREDLLDPIRALWFLIRGTKPEFIGSGENNRMFRVGQLESGLWVAFRTPVENPELAPDLILDRYEFFCQEAERYHNVGERVPRFCVGVQGPDESNIGIFLEDLTAGGTRKLLLSSYGDCIGHFEDDPKTEVLFDIDNLYCGPPPQLKYFRPEFRIDLGRKPRTLN